jgi:hypothetical protein
MTENVEALKDAMWQLLDDMGAEGQSVCLAAKAQARIAFEPFQDPNAPTPMDLDYAKSVIANMSLD